jgi:hypothetical protein
VKLQDLKVGDVACVVAPETHHFGVSRLPQTVIKIHSYGVVRFRDPKDNLEYDVNGLDLQNGWQLLSVCKVFKELYSEELNK